MNDMSNTTIDILVRYGYRVAVIYTAGGITVNITKAGRGQECSGLDADDMLEKMVARLVDAGEVPIGALSDREAQIAGKEVQVNQEPESVRSHETEGVFKVEGGGNLELDSETQAGRKAKKVAR